MQMKLFPNKYGTHGRCRLMLVFNPMIMLTIIQESKLRHFFEVHNIETIYIYIYIYMFLLLVINLASGLGGLIRDHNDVWVNKFLQDQSTSVFVFHNNNNNKLVF